MTTSDISGTSFIGMGQNGGAPFYKSVASSSQTTLFGGSIPAVHFGPVAKMSSPAPIAPTWHSATATPIVGGHLNVTA